MCNAPVIFFGAEAKNSPVTLSGKSEASRYLAAATETGAAMPSLAGMALIMGTMILRMKKGALRAAPVSGALPGDMAFTVVPGGSFLASSAAQYATKSLAFAYA